MLSSEVFPARKEPYVAAFADRATLPADPADVPPDPVAIARLESVCARLSPALDRNRILVRPSCHRPVTQDGLPLIGRCAASTGRTSPPATAAGASWKRRRPV